MNKTFEVVETNRNWKLWLGLVLLVGILIRILFFFYYPPRMFGDTGGYMRASEAVLNGFSNYDGTRTPVYPVFIAFLKTETAIYIGQLILGLSITTAWFFIGTIISNRPVFGAIAALAHTLNPGQIFFEANLLTETLSTFWLTMAILGACVWLSQEKKSSILLGLGVGLCAALAVLSRPQFIFMPFLLVAFLAFSFKDKKLKCYWRSILSILLPLIIFVGGWMGWIYNRYGIFSVTTMSGFHMVQHTGYYFEDTPDEFAGLRDVYLEYRDARMAEFGTQSNTIWDAIPAMQEASGLDFYQLSSTLQKISVKLILTHPGQYLMKVLKGLWLFWRAPVYWDSSVFSGTSLFFLRAWVLGSRGLLILANMIFILSSLCALFIKKVRKLFKLQQFHWLIAGSIWMTAVLTSLLEHGENQRFLIPLQTTAVFWALWIAYAVWNNQSVKHRDLQKI